MPRITLARITDWHDPFLIASLRLYEMAFPDGERDYTADILRYVRDGVSDRGGRVEMLAILQGREYRGFFIVEWLDGDRVVYLWYFSILPAHRNQGIGGVAYRYLIQAAAGQGCRAAVFEAESPDHQSDPEAEGIARRRLAFYRRQGAKLLDGIRYEYEIEGKGSIPYCVMIHPLQKVGPKVAAELAERYLDGDLERVGQLALL